MLIQITIDTLILFDKEGRLYYHLSRIINLIRLFPPPKKYLHSRAHLTIFQPCTSFLCLRQHFSLCVCFTPLLLHTVWCLYRHSKKYINNAGYCEIVSITFKGNPMNRQWVFESFRPELAIELILGCWVLSIDWVFLIHSKWHPVMKMKNCLHLPLLPAL